jgi:hypothetical protein
LSFTTLIFVLKEKYRYLLTPGCLRFFTWCLRFFTFHLAKMKKFVTTTNRGSPAPRDYRKLYCSLVKANRRAIKKLRREERNAGYWKHHHQDMVNTIWRWTRTAKPDHSTFFARVPSGAKKRKAEGFTFPGESPTTPEKKRPDAAEATTPVKDKNVVPLDLTGDLASNRRSVRLAAQK